MLRHMMLDTLRDVTRWIMPGPSVTTVEVKRPAANASRWIKGDGQARRLRRRRRMERSVPSPLAGWTVRTW